MPLKTLSHKLDANLQEAALVEVIAYACGMAGQFDGSKHGPDTVHEMCHATPALASGLQWTGRIEDDRAFRDLPPHAILTEVGKHADQLARQTLRTLENRHFPLLIGGDHAAAAGFWSGVSEGFRSTGQIGMLWIDAHMDSHTPETSPKGYVHGMPLAGLLGEGHPCLTQILHPGPKLRPQSVCVIGVRDFEPEEKMRLDRLGVRIFYDEEVRQKGLETIMPEALSIVTDETCGYGVSFDLDSLDPQDSCGVSTPVEGGLRATEALVALTQLVADPRLLGLEISEFNPSNDIGNRTLQYIGRLLNAVVTTRNGRKG